MSLLAFFEWCETTTIGTTVRDSIWLFPVIESVHLLALALLGGTVLVVDLRMLGLGMRGRTVSQVARYVQPRLIGCVAAMIATGVPLFLSEPIKCYYSPPFWYKMMFLALAILFTFTVRRRVAAAADANTGLLREKLVALISLGLWLSVGFSGRWIAFY